LLEENIREHPLRSLVVSLISFIGVLSGVYTLFPFELKYAVLAFCIYGVGFILAYVYCRIISQAAKYFENQSTATKKILTKILKASREIKIISFTSETYFALISQKIIEGLLDRGIKFKILVSHPENENFLRDDKRARYGKIINTYIKRWSDLGSITRSIEIRTYKSIPIFRAIIIDDIYYFIGTYYYPLQDYGDSNQIYYIKINPNKKYRKNAKGMIAKAFDYIWSHSIQYHS